MEKALVLAGGFPQIALIKELKVRGYYVVLADWNEEPVAKKYCDKYYQVSTLDVEAIKRVAIEENIDMVITICTDQALLTVSKVSEELGLPCYIDYKTGLNVTNKQYMKNVFAKNDIPTAKYVILDSLSHEKIKHLSFPLITKPVDCNSSKGVIKAYNYNELYNAFENAKQLSRTNTAIVEEFIEGKELTVDAYVSNGKSTVLSISVNEKIKDDGKFVIYRSLNPAKISSVIERQISETVQKIATAFNLIDSPMLIQMLATEEKAYVIEFSARTGGGVKYLLIKDVSGFDVVKAVVDLTTGIKPKVEAFEREQKYLVNEFIYCKPGKFDHLEGFDNMKNDKVISDYYLFKWKGAEFDSVSNSGDRIAGFTIKGDSIAELNRKNMIAQKHLKVVDSNGNDIMRHDLIADIEEGDF